jgi:hypothetical protein
MSRWGIGIARRLHRDELRHIAATLDDDVGMRLEQADQFLAGRHGFPGEDAALGLADEALDQGQVMADLDAPGYGFDGGADGQRRAACRSEAKVAWVAAIRSR